MLRQYLGLGGTLMAGMEPSAVSPGGQVVSSGYGGVITQQPGRVLPLMTGQAPGFNKMTGWQRAGDVAPGAAGLAFSGYQIYQGYQEGGLAGAASYGMIDLAASAGAARFAYGSPGTRGHQPGSGYGNRFQRLGLKASATQLSYGGFMSLGARYLGGSVGATVGMAAGQAVGGLVGATGLPGSEALGGAVGMGLGTAGALAGGYVGAAPLAGSVNALRLAGVNPVIGGLAVAGGAMAAVGVATAGYGTYHVSKAVANAGYAHSQMQRGVHTSGSMAAFMTRGATTMRARAVQAFHRNHMNARSALGQEANFMHYSGRNYHSRYR